MPGELILAIDDEVDITTIIKRALEVKGYKVETAASGQEGIKKAKELLPDLIISDIMMEGMDGYEVCSRLKNDRRTRFIPIIMLTAKDQIKDKITGMESGSDDYLTKPFSFEELEARIKWILKKTALQIAANPLTGLPGNPSIEEEIKRRIEKKENFAVLYVDIDNFKAYNDKYGYTWGDEIIRLTAQILIDVVDEVGTEQDFIGHIGGDDFILITRDSNVDKIAEFIISKFDNMVPYQYPRNDRKRGYVKVVDRQGKEVFYPLMTISIAGVTNKKGNFVHYAQVSERLMEVKRYTKSQKGSVFIKDRRLNGG
ncbi:TPA: diguanylate cyclase response regulator [bacterium]|nr:diguanylate cyclase response regulator [bacterium]